VKVSVILAHPNPSSLNHAIAREVVETLRASGYQVAFHDLYAEGFDPILPTEELPTDAALRSADLPGVAEEARSAGPGRSATRDPFQ
jgi:putative NADPH-quinone reductase